MEELNIINMRTHASENLEFNTVNEILHIIITEKNKPEIELEDNSILIFSDSLMYYNTILDQNNSGKINMDILNLKYRKQSDDVVGAKYRNMDIYEVEMYNHSSGYIYRLKF